MATKSAKAKKGAGTVRKRQSAKKSAGKKKGTTSTASQSFKARDVMGLLLIAAGLFALLSVFIEMGAVGAVVRGALFRALGVAAYALPVVLIVAGWLVLISYRFMINAGKVAVVCMFCLDALLLCQVLVHSKIVGEMGANPGYGEYITACASYAGVTRAGAGGVGGALAWPIAFLLGTVGSYIFIAVVAVGCIVLLTRFSLSETSRKVADAAIDTAGRAARAAQDSARGYKEQRVQSKEQRAQEQSVRAERPARKKRAQWHNVTVSKVVRTDQGPDPEFVDLRTGRKHAGGIDAAPLPFAQGESPFTAPEGVTVAPITQAIERDIPRTVFPQVDGDVSDLPVWAMEPEAPAQGVSADDIPTLTRTQEPAAQVEKEPVWIPLTSHEPPASDEAPMPTAAEFFAGGTPLHEEDGQSVAAIEPMTGAAPLAGDYFSLIKEDPSETAVDATSTHNGMAYRYPPLALLAKSKVDETKKQDNDRENEECSRLLVETLASFGIESQVVGISQGPTLTRYELKPAAGVKVSRITGLADDIALNMAAVGVRIEAPIPGKAAVGIEVPNLEVAPVTLREVLESEEFKSHPSRLAFALGKDIAGKPMVADLARMPHLLIAGATGSGKSVCINALVASILYKASPDEVKLIMIDPKVVELSIYNSIPHLLVPVVTDPKKAAGALNWAVMEMGDRYKKFAASGCRDLKGYNEYARGEGEDPLPQIVVIIDELADLMMASPKDVEDYIFRLAQLARAAGIHLVIATQRPSVNVITGVIKSNIPSRIAFAMASQVDSRTILDMAGAEKLLGRGDMLYDPSGASKPLRVQGCLITDKEVAAVVESIKVTTDTQYNPDIQEMLERGAGGAQGAGATGGEEDEGVDELLAQAVELAIDSGQVSTSMLQRRFRIGYARAGRLVDEMENRGLVSGFEGSKPRTTLVSREEYNRLFGGEG